MPNRRVLHQCLRTSDHWRAPTPAPALQGLSVFTSLELLSSFQCSKNSIRCNWRDPADVSSRGFYRSILLKNDHACPNFKKIWERQLSQLSTCIPLDHALSPPSPFLLLGHDVWDGPPSPMHCPLVNMGPFSMAEKGCYPNACLILKGFPPRRVWSGAFYDVSSARARLCLEIQRAESETQIGRLYALPSLSLIGFSLVGWA